MEEIKKKNKKLKKVAIILFIIIILIVSYCAFLYYQSEINVDYAMDVSSKKMQIQEVKIDVFNSEFMSYYGRQKGTTIKALSASIIRRNISNENRLVSITGLGYENEILYTYEAIPNIKTKQYYEVTMYQDEEGFINKIFIKEEGEPKTEEELKLEQIKQRREEELKLIEQEMKREELKERIILSVIILLVVLVSLILIIKTVKILKGNDENKKHKVLLTLVIIESIIIGAFLLFILVSCIPINTGII